MRWKFKSTIIIHRKITWLLLFSVFSLGVASWLIYISKRNTERAAYRINQTHQLIETAQELIITLAQNTLPAQSTSLTDSLTPVPASPQTIPYRHPGLQQQLLRLDQLSATNNDQPQRIAQLQLYIHQHLAAPTIISLLYDIIEEEKLILSQRWQLYEAANQRTAYGMLIGRALAFLFVAIILIQLNRDITRRKKIQEQLVKAIQEAHAAKQLQEQFLANMSHEIRTPMNGIKGMTDLLLDTPLSVRQHELTGMIKSSAGNLLVIINDILDFSKIKAGKLNIEKIDFSLCDVLDSVITSFEHRIKKKGLTLRTDIAADIPPQLTGDPHRLNQVLINLIGNAIKFTDQGSIYIDVTAERKFTDEVIIHFTIADTGMGIPAENLPYIFDSFSQAGGDISRRYGGTGLGLTICRQLLHLQGGNITATSIEGKGSSFHFHLPYGYKDQPNARIAAPDNSFDYSNLLRGRNFLVAEDNEINQKLIDYVLTKAGATVLIAANGAEAVNVLRTGRAFDLIIMDLQMPEMDGYTATRYIRNDLHIHTPIIAMTATAMKGEHLQCLESGMNEYMTKPFEFTDLYKRISGLLS